MFQTTKSQRRKLRRALREYDFVYLGKAFLFHLRLSHFFWFTRNGYKMYAHYTPFAFWLWSEKSARASIRSDELFYKNFLREGDTVIDAGANIGLCTLMSASIVGKTGKVYSLEAHPRTYTQLVSNIKLNKYKQVYPYNIGVSNKKEQVPFSDEYVTDINHVDKSFTEKKQIQVQLDTIDNILQGIGEITVYKLDVEGYEYFALQGSQNILQKTKVVYFESSPTSFARQGYELRDILLFLEKLGFDTYSLDTDERLIKINKDYQTTSNYENLVALRPVEEAWFTERITLQK
jgi:FkbM family methyltransferase